MRFARRWWRSRRYSRRLRRSIRWPGRFAKQTPGGDVPMRYEMARALVRRARERATWIGDDHGNPYGLNFSVFGTVCILVGTVMGSLTPEVLCAIQWITWL